MYRIEREKSIKNKKMSWADKKIEEYKEGGTPTFLEKRALEHADPVNCIATIMAFAVLIYGLWTNEWFLIGISVTIGFIGHIVSWLRK